jgi:hypothetical protein
MAYPAGLGQQLGDLPMKNYSIVRSGDGYVVQADEKSVLKVASRRTAAKLVTHAAELLRALPPEPSITRDPGIVPDPKFLDGSRQFPYAPRRDTSPQREAYYLEG